MPGTMRGVYTNLTEIRRKVFAGVARIAYEQGEDSEGDLQRLPYEIVPGEIATASPSSLSALSCRSASALPWACRCRALTSRRA